MTLDLTPIVFWPKPQCVYVDVMDGTMGRFDSWLKDRIGFYRLSTGRFVKLPVTRMRKATSSEVRLFDRAKAAKVECAIYGH